MPVGDVAARELDLSEFGERLQCERAFGMALGNSQPRAPAKQSLRQVRAEEPTAADQHDELAFERCEMSHGLVSNPAGAREVPGAERSSDLCRPMPHGAEGRKPLGSAPERPLASACGQIGNRVD